MRSSNFSGINEAEDLDDPVGESSRALRTRVSHSDAEGAEHKVNAVIEFQLNRWEGEDSGDIVGESSKALRTRVSVIPMSRR